jgi:photosystem II stability/assembly factor-like uncharacterized protein
MKFLITISFILVIGFVNAQWVQTNGPEGGSITSIKFSGNNIYALCSYSGIYLSTDNANTWTKIRSGNCSSMALVGTTLFVTQSFTVYSTSNNGLTWSPAGNSLPPINNSGKLLENGNDLFAVIPGSGIFLSTNFGVSWTAQNTGLTNLDVNAITINGSDIYCGTLNGIFHSSNYGNSWTLVHSGIPNIECMAHIGSNLFIGTRYSGFYYSNNNGVTWTQRNNNLTNHSIICFKVAGNIIYSGNLGGGLQYSTDYGINWIRIPTSFRNIISTIEFIGSDLAVGAVGVGLMVTPNNGITWQSKINGIIGSVVRALAVKGNLIAAGTDKGGVSISSDGGNTWSPMNTSLSHTAIWSMTFHGTDLYAGTDSGVYFSNDSARTWTLRSTNLGSIKINDLISENNNIYAVSQFRSAYMLTPGISIFWQNLSNVLSPFSAYSVFVKGASILAGDELLHYSYNNGTSWDTIPGSSIFIINPKPWIDLLEYNGDYYGICGGVGIFRIATNFNSITSVNSPTPYNYFLAKNNYGIYTYSWDKVYASYNNTISWNDIHAGLDNQSVNSLIGNVTELYAGTFGNGVYKFLHSPLPVELLSFTGKNNKENNILEWITSSEINNSGFEVERSADGKDFSKIGFVEGHGNSTIQNEYYFTNYSIDETYYYRLKQLDFDGKYSYSNTIVISTRKKSFFLFTNPLSNLFSIHFLSECKQVVIEIYNVNGQKISAEYFSDINSGFSKNLNSDLASGIYFLKINYDGKEEFRKFVID